jgi:hypothetical protein
MRHLRPGRLIELESGLWAVDGTQPVAAVLDPLAGSVRGVVSWSELPPAPPGEVEPAPRVLGDGTSLWIQQQESGPLVRIDLDGAVTGVWTNGLLLGACGPRVAWCAPRPPSQELIHGKDAAPTRDLGPDRLLRVGVDGRCTVVGTEYPVRSVQAEPDGLMVRVDVDPWQLRHLGLDTYEVVRATRWLALPWDAPVPEELTVASHGVPDGQGPRVRPDDGQGVFNWYHPGVENDPLLEEAVPVAAAGLSWHLGWSMDLPSERGGGVRRVLASAHDDTGAVVRQWDLGDGTVLAVAAVDTNTRLAVGVQRPPEPPWMEDAPVEVLALHPHRNGVTVLLPGDAVDITELCWPLVPRPLDTDSYVEQVRVSNDSINAYWHREQGDEPLALGLSQGQARLSGTWPHTHLEWTFAFDPYPGLTLRRRVPLFDELDRITPPQYPDINLMEDLDTGALPPANAARHGILDI